MPAAIAIPLIASAIGTGGSMASAAMGKKTTSSSNQANRDPQQQQVHDQLAKIFGDQMAAGPKVPQWMNNSGKTEINETYNSMLPRFEQAMAARGFDTSGKVGNTAQAIEMGRGNAFGKLQASLTSYADQRYQQMLSMAQQFQNPNSSTTTNTGPNPWQTAIPGMTGDISTMLQLLSKNAGSGGGGNLSMSGGGSGGTYVP